MFRRTTFLKQNLKIDVVKNYASLLTQINKGLCYGTIQVHYNAYTNVDSRSFNYSSVAYNKLTKFSKYYSILDIPRNASKTEIKQAYLDKCKEFHPDLHSGNNEMHIKFVEINKAYETLMNYDGTTASKRTTATHKQSSDFYTGYHQKYPFSKGDKQNKSSAPTQTDFKMNNYSRAVILSICTCFIYYVAVTVMLYVKRHNFREHIKKLSKDGEYQQTKALQLNLEKHSNEK